MSNAIKNKHDKKSNVINRTTSETLRLGETDPNIGHRVLPQASSSLSIQSLPSGSRKKIQSSSSSFQITGVSLTRSDFGDDSADDLDESHTDDISRVTDNETPSFSEDSRDTDEHPIYEAPSVSNSQVIVQAEPVQVQPTQKPPDEDAGARFKVVKMPSQAPFNRGRWTCFDYLDNSEQNLNISYIYSDQKFIKQNLDNIQRARPLAQASCIQGIPKYSSINYPRPMMVNDVIRMESLLYENTFLADLSPPYNALQQSSDAIANASAESSKGYPQGYLPVSPHVGVGNVGAAQIESAAYFVTGQELVPCHSQKSVSRQDSSSGQQVENDLSDIKVALTSTCVASNSGSAPNNNNIDRKIEEALDAVKTHLMVAVHKEVDFLKTRVSTLEGRVNELEIENSILRVNYLLFKS